MRLNFLTHHIFQGWVWWQLILTGVHTNAEFMTGRPNELDDCYENVTYQDGNDKYNRACHYEPSDGEEVYIAICESLPFIIYHFYISASLFPQ